MVVALKNTWLREFNENHVYAMLATAPGSFHRVCVHTLRISVIALEEEVLMRIACITTMLLRAAP